MHKKTNMRYAFRNKRHSQCNQTYDRSRGMSLLDFRMQLREEEAAKTTGTRNDQLAPLNKTDIGKLHAGSASFHQNSSTIMETENSDSGLPGSPTNRHKFDILTISNPSIRTP